MLDAKLWMPFGGETALRDRWQVTAKTEGQGGGSMLGARSCELRGKGTTGKTEGYQRIKGPRREGEGTEREGRGWGKEDSGKY